MTPILDKSLVKSWLRIEEDFTEDDAIIDLLIINAESYIRDAVTNFDSKIQSPSNLAKARFIGLMLIVDWYEKRDITGIVSDTVRYSFTSVMLQLQMGGV